MMIDAHKIGEDMSFYISQPYTCWLHMPVDRGELITEIYKGRGLLDHDRALGVGRDSSCTIVFDRADSFSDKNR